jgi:hypothetical protein
MNRWADFLYREEGLDSDPCIYCGSASECWDHIPPIHFITRLLQLDITIDNKLRKVRACSECNLLLAGFILTTIPARKRFLFNQYFIKNDRRIRKLKWNTLQNRTCRRCKEIFIPLHQFQFYCDKLCQRSYELSRIRQRNNDIKNFMAHGTGPPP